jgi:hypothetical protein
MRHLTPDELVDILESGAIAETVRSHVAGCETCRARIDEISAVLTEARNVVVPEPSPLYWERLSDRVRLAVAVEPVEPAPLTQWLQWPVLVPLTGLAAIILALSSVIAPRTGQLVSSPETRVGVSELPVIEETDTASAESTWALVSDLVGPLDLDMAREAGFATGPGTADEAIMQLTAAEQEELVRLLQQELKQPGG